MAKLWNAFVNNDAVAAEEVAAAMTQQEREAYAYRLNEMSVFLRRVNKSWADELNYPASNEE